MKRRFLILGIVIVLVLCGCKNIFINEIKEPPTRGFVTVTYDIGNSNELYYSKIAELDEVNCSDVFENRNEMGKYSNVDIALAWVLERKKGETDYKYHVILEYIAEHSGGDNETIKNIYDEAIEAFNQEYSTDLDTRTWSYIDFRYYCVLTREEVVSLGESEDFYLRYIGSGEGNYNEIDVSTLEGVDVFVELYGDGYVQSIDGKEIKNYRK